MAVFNEELTEELIRDGYLKTPRIIEAFKKIDRKNFVSQEFMGEAYGNYPLSIGYGQAISQPLTVAFMLELLSPLPGEKILDVGFGSGWTTALLAQIVTSGPEKLRNGAGKKQTTRGMVVAVERIPELCEIGKRNVQKYNFVGRKIVIFFCGDGSRGVPEELLPAGGFDKVLAGAAAQKEVPDIWKRQLKVGGRIVAPVENSVVAVDKIPKNKFSAKGKPAFGWKTKEYLGFSFVPLVSD